MACFRIVFLIFPSLHGGGGFWLDVEYLPLSRSLSPSLPPTRSPSRSRSLSPSASASVSLCVSLSVSLCVSLSLSLFVFLSVSLSLPLSLPLSLSPSLPAPQVSESVILSLSRQSTYTSNISQKGRHMFRKRIGGRPRVLAQPSALRVARPCLRVNSCQSES